MPEVWEKHFGHLRAKAFGIGGDRTEHLLWRLRHGEMGHMDPAVVVLLIGTLLSLRVSLRVSLRPARC